MVWVPRFFGLTQLWHHSYEHGSIEEPAIFLGTAFYVPKEE